MERVLPYSRVHCRPRGVWSGAASAAHLEGGGCDVGVVPGATGQPWSELVHRYDGLQRVGTPPRLDSGLPAGTAVGGRVATGQRCGASAGEGLLPR